MSASTRASHASAVARRPPGEEEHGEDADETERRAELDEAHEDAEERHPDGGAFRVMTLTMTRTMAPAASASSAAISPTRSGLHRRRAQRAAMPASAHSTHDGGAIGARSAATTAAAARGEPPGEGSWSASL
jgi:hypothetical protein